ncbi:MAG: hypothetical protein GF331_03100 [Chitinivibrionales bacterium]|nr:hypothetical protein [Chitinivibrionales bacterium]
MSSRSFAFVLAALLLLAFDGATAPADSVSAAAAGSVADTAANPLAADSIAIDSIGPRGSTLTDTVRYEADVIRYDLAGRVVHLAGNAKAAYEDVTLYADTIRYRIDENLFTAMGSPKLVEGNDVTVGDTLSYNIKTKRGYVRYATTKMSDEYFTGQRIVKSKENHLYIEDGDYTTCAHLEEPHYTFYGRNLKIIPKDIAICRPVIMHIGEAPVAIFPYYPMPLERGRRSGFLTPGWGGHPTSGGYLDNIGYYWAPNDYLDFTLAGKVKEFRELLLTAGTRYRLRYWLNGSISADYHIDSDYRISSQRWSLSFAHNQNLLPDGSFTLQGNGRLASSSRDNKTFFQEHSDNPYEVIQQNLGASLALQKRLPKLNTSILLGWNRQHNLTNDHVGEDLPYLRFSLNDRALIPQKKTISSAGSESEDENKPKWYNNIYYSYGLNAKLRREDYLDKDTLGEFTLPGLMQTASIRSNQKIFKWFTFSQSINARLSTFYGYMDTTVQGYRYEYDVIRDTVDLVHPDSTYAREDYGPQRRDYGPYQVADTLLPSPTDTDEDTAYVLSWRALEPDSTPYYDTTWDDFAHDAVWDASASLSTTLYGHFPIRIFNFVGLRHEFTPTLSYRFTPEHEQDKQFFNVGMQATRGHDRRQELGIQVRNLFQGKIRKEPEEEGAKPEEKRFTILNANLSTSYNFEADEHKWSDIRLNASTALKFMRVGFNSQFWLYDGGDEGGKLTWPRLKSYSIDISPNNFAVGGRFWGGDRLVLDGVAPDDPVTYHNAGHQQWRLSLSPSYHFSAARRTPDDVFKPTKRYQLSASASLGFTRNWSVSWGSTFDFLKNTFVRHSLNFRCDMECWDMVFNWTPQGVLPGHYYFRINIKKIPDIKWEERP